MSRVLRQMAQRRNTSENNIPRNGKDLNSGVTSCVIVIPPRSMVTDIVMRLHSEISAKVLLKFCSRASHTFLSGFTCGEAMIFLAKRIFITALHTMFVHDKNKALNSFGFLDAKLNRTAITCCISYLLHVVSSNDQLPSLFHE